MNHSVMFFLPHLGGGGAEMNAVRVGSVVYSFGFKASFAVCRSGGSYAELLLGKDVQVKVLETGRVNFSTLRLVRSVRPLREHIMQEAPDVVCPVMDAPSLAALEALRKCNSRTKVVLSIQNSLKARYINCRHPRARLELGLIRRLFPCADHIVALSHGVADELKELVPELNGRISVVHNAGLPGGADENATGSQPLKGSASGQLIVACGRLVEQKGYPYLLRTFAQLVKGRDAHLWVLGEGPLRGALLALADSLGVSSRVRFLGFQDDPQAYMRAADVFVLSSLWEGFGNVIVEAMAAGTPVIATDCPHGPSEIIQDDVNGLLVPPGDEGALAEALERVLGDADLRRRLSAGALVRSRDFTPEIIARQYAAVFSDVLSA